MVFPQAVADFTAVIELQPLHALAHRKRGELLYERFHDVPRAVRDLVQVAALEPKQLHPALYQSYQHMGFATEVPVPLRVSSQSIIL